MRIEIVDLAKSYVTLNDEVRIFSHLNAQLPSGTFASLIGPSGVGKSTLLHLLGTLDAPSAGSIFLDGIDPHLLSPAEVSYFRNTNIGFVFQFHHLLPEFSALENVMMPLLVRRKTRLEAERIAEEWLSKVGLAHRVQHKPGELSGGEQQRVALARAYVNQPKLLLADEPTGNLDEETGAAIMQLMRQAQEEYSITTLVVTHNLKLAQQAPTRLQLRKEGLFVL